MKRLLVIAVLSIGLAGLLSPGSASALTFSPPTFDFSADPGASVTDAVRLHNEGAAPVTLRVEAMNFAAMPGDETEGVPDFYPASEVRNGRELAPWITFINKDLTLQPGERGSLFYEIKIPDDAGPGSYFGAVVVTSIAPGAEEGVSIVGNTAVLVLLKVNGEASEELKLASFTSDPATAPSLPVRFTARVENAGNVHLRPVGEVRIKDVFGRTAAVIPMNRAEFKSVLPAAARRFTSSWSRAELPEGASAWERQMKNFAFGPYTAELTLEYGSGKKVLTATSRFWVLPLLPILAAIGGSAALFMAVRGFFRWYRKRIIAQLERRNP
jgi:hypothetical protein